jgi:hypothetical protein
MKVNLDELNKITSLLLSKLKEKLGNEIEVNSDFYWDISDEDIYDPYQEPKNITLGQLSDEITEFQNSINSQNGACYDLKLLSNILKALYIENVGAF